MDDEAGICHGFSNKVRQPMHGLHPETSKAEDASMAKLGQVQAGGHLHVWLISQLRLR